jgi:hypothetical protein
LPSYDNRVSYVPAKYVSASGLQHSTHEADQVELIYERRRAANLDVIQ